jgi:hypothetical protein
MGNKKARIFVMICVLTNGCKLLGYVILWQKAMPKANVPVGLTFRCHDCLNVVWNQRPCFLVNKCGTFVPDAFKGHLTQEVKEEI